MVKGITCSEDMIRTITPDEVWHIIREDKKEEYLLIDVRTPEEYEKEHIPGARLIPLNKLDRRSFELDRQKKVITYCRSGRRSMGGAILLCNQNFKELFNMEGGITNWPYERVKGLPEEAEEVFKEIKEIKEFLLFAIQMEKASQIFYHQVAQKVDEKELVGLLEKLSQAEENHMENLYIRLRELWPETPLLEELKETGYMEGAILLPQALLAVGEKLPYKKIDILEIALEKECKAFDLYQRMAIKVEPPLKEFFKDLAEQEREHIDELYLYI